MAQMGLYKYKLYIFRYLFKSNLNFKKYSIAITKSFQSSDYGMLTWDLPVPWFGSEDNSEPADGWCFPYGALHGGLLICLRKSPTPAFPVFCFSNTPTFSPSTPCTEGLSHRHKSVCETEPVPASLGLEGLCTSIMHCVPDYLEESPSN